MGQFSFISEAAYESYLKGLEQTEFPITKSNRSASNETEKRDDKIGK